MAKPLKVLLILLLALLIFIGGAGIIIKHWVTPERIKPWLSHLSQENTGYDLSITGKLQLSLFPTPSIEIQRLSLSKPQQNTPHITADHVSATLRLTPLLYKTLAIKNIRAKTLRINTADNNTFMLSKLSASMQADAQSLRLSNLQATLYQGTLKADALFQLKHPSSYQIDATCRHLKLAPLMQDLRGQSPLSGKLNARITLKNTGPYQSLQHLAGTLKATLRDGAIDLKPWQQSIANDKIMQNIQAVTQLKQPDKLAFEKINIQSTIKHGIAHSTLSLDAATLRAHINGDIDLKQQQLQLQAKLYYLNSKKLKQQPIPLTITGHYLTPKITLNHNALINQLLQDTIKQQQNKLKQKLKNINLDSLPIKLPF